MCEEKMEGMENVDGPHPKDSHDPSIHGIPGIKCPLCDGWDEKDAKDYAAL